MPSVAKAHDAPATAPPSHTRLSRSDQDLLSAINATVDRMHTYTSDDPYVLTIPQDGSRYEHHYQFETKQWLDRTPFQTSEREKMQYQTFHFKEQGKDMFVLENSRREVEAAESKAANHNRASVSNSGNATPNVKKISLNAYKKKHAGGTPKIHDKPQDEIPARPPAVKGPLERIKAESDQVLLEAADGEDEPTTDSIRAVKRKREGLNHDENAKEKRNEGRGPSDVSSRDSNKRQRTPSPDFREKEKGRKSSTHKPTNGIVAEVQSEVDDTTELPPRLLPPRLSPLSVPAMPPRLSPTLPANIEASLRARDMQKAPSGSSKPKTVSKSSPVVNGGTSPSPPKSSSPTLPSDPETNPKPSSSKPVKMRDEKQRDAASKTQAAKKLPTSSSSLIIKLKYKKHQRDAIKRLSNMRPSTRVDQNDAKLKPKSKESAPVVDGSSQQARSRDQIAKGIAQKIGPTSSSTSKKPEEKKAAQEKRPLTTDPVTLSGPAAKRVKVSQAPSTPMRTGALTPTATSNPSKSSQQVTPNLRKDHLSVAMKREHSSEGNVNTPTGRSISTPTVVDKTSVPLARSNQTMQSSSKTPKQQAWESMQKQLESLGRGLKHAASAHLQSVNKEGSESPSEMAKEQKLAAVKSLESMLAYILAFTCADQTAITADPRRNLSIKPWQTLTGFYNFVKRNCESFRPLLGLACFLGVAFYARILEISSQRPSDGPSREMILDTYNMLQRALTEAETVLHVDAIMTYFPDSWAARSSKGTLAALSALEKPGRFSGPFRLPVGLQTPPILSVRAGHAMLQEWLAKQSELDYKLELKLSL